jgi:hypothetical protein
LRKIDWWTGRDRKWKWPLGLDRVRQVDDKRVREVEGDPTNGVRSEVTTY